LWYSGSMHLISPYFEEWQEATHLLGWDPSKVALGEVFYHQGHFCEMEAYIRKAGVITGIRYKQHEFYDV